MRYLFLALTFLGCHAQLFAQSSISIEYGQNFTNLRFTDDMDQLNEDMTPNFSSSFNIGYAYTLKEGVFFSSKIGLRQAGASYVYDDFNYRWDLNYTEFRLGVGYSYNTGPLSVHFSTQGYFGYLFKATQQLHHLERDMLAQGAVEDMDYGLFFSPGVSYPLNEKISLQLDGNYMLGLANIETDEGQKTTNNLIGASLGIKINL